MLVREPDGTWRTAGVGTVTVYHGRDADEHAPDRRSPTSRAERQLAGGVAGNVVAAGKVVADGSIVSIVTLLMRTTIFGACAEGSSRGRAELVDLADRVEALGDLTEDGVEERRPAEPGRALLR